MPDLVSKLREVIAHAKTKTPCASNYECLLADLLTLESLLGREGQAAPVCEYCNALWERKGRWHRHPTGTVFAYVCPSPSTPIVPGTAGLSAFADEIKLLLKMAEDCDARGEVQSPQKEWTFYQGKIVAYKHILSLLGAAKPVGISIDALEDLMQQFKQREARIRKDVLEEAAQHVPKLVCSDGPISQNAGGSYTIATVGCSCGWNGNPAGGWSAHILAAERPAPAGEVKRT